MDLDAYKLLGIQYFWIQFFYPEPTPNYLYKTFLNLLVWVFPHVCSLIMLGCY